MADNPYDKYVAQPVDASNPYAKYLPGFEPPKPTDGQFVGGFKRAFQEVPGLAAGVLAYGADVAGANDTRDALIDYAKRKNEELAQAHQNDAQSLTDTWDGKTGWLDFLANASGYVAGQALQGIATGGLGAFGAKLIARQGIKELAEVTAAKSIAAGASEAKANAAVLKAVTEASSKSLERGAVAGAGAHNFGMELGSIYPDAVDQAKEDGKTGLDGGDKFRVLAAASLAAGVDTAGEAIMAIRAFKGAKTGAPKVDADGVIQPGPGLLGRAAREIPAGAAREAGTEAIQTALEHYGAGQPIADEKGVKDIIDSAGVGAVGGMLGGALAARKAHAPEEQKAPDLPSVPDTTKGILNAGSLDEAIATMEASIPSSKTQTPRQAAAPSIAEIRQLDTNQQDEALGLLATSQNPKASAQVRRFAANRLDEMLLGVRQLNDRSLIPLGEATEIQPLEVSTTRGMGELRQVNQDTQKFNDEATWADGSIPAPEVSEHELIPTGEATVLPRRPIPTGEATELDAEPIPVGEASDYDVPSGMTPRSRSDGHLFDLATLLNAPHAVSNYLQHVQSLGTPAARAFIQDHRAGRITNDDVMSLLVPTRDRAEPPGASAQRIAAASDRLAAAAAQAPAIQPGDLLTADGMPYGSKVAAQVRARKEGGQLVTVPGGWVVRKEKPNDQLDLFSAAPVPPATPPAGGDQPGGSGGTVRPVAPAGPAAGVQAQLPSFETGRRADQLAVPGSERDGALTAAPAPQTLADKVKARKATTAPGVAPPNEHGVYKPTETLQAPVKDGRFKVEIAPLVDGTWGYGSENTWHTGEGGVSGISAHRSAATRDDAVRKGLEALRRRIEDPSDYGKTKKLAQAKAVNKWIDAELAKLKPAATPVVSAREVAAKAQPADRDWATATPAELEAEIDRLYEEHRTLNKRQLATPGIDSPERMALLKQMDENDGVRRRLEKLLPDEDAAVEETAPEAKFGEPGYEPPENWRTSLYQARQYAKEMGIPLEGGYAGKDLAGVVKMIDAKLKPMGLVDKIKARKDEPTKKGAEAAQTEAKVFAPMLELDDAPAVSATDYRLESTSPTTGSTYNKKVPEADVKIKVRQLADGKFNVWVGVSSNQYTILGSPRAFDFLSQRRFDTAQAALEEAAAATKRVYERTAGEQLRGKAPSAADIKLRQRVMAWLDTVGAKKGKTAQVEAAPAPAAALAPAMAPAAAPAAATETKPDHTARAEDSWADSGGVTPDDFVVAMRASHTDIPKHGPSNALGLAATYATSPASRVGSSEEDRRQFQIDRTNKLRDTADKSDFEFEQDLKRQGRGEMEPMLANLRKYAEDPTRVQQIMAVYRAIGGSQARQAVRLLDEAKIYWKHGYFVQISDQLRRAASSKAAFNREYNPNSGGLNDQTRQHIEAKLTAEGVKKFQVLGPKRAADVLAQLGYREDGKYATKPKAVLGTLTDKIKARKDAAILAQLEESEGPVNGKQPPADLPADERLVLMPCGDTKLKTRAPAGNLYTGPMWQTLRTHGKPGATPHTVVLSAKHGFVATGEELDPYDQRMTAARADELLADPKQLADQILKAVGDRPNAFKDVLIVGGEEYRRVMSAAVEILRQRGVVDGEASINATRGQIGEQRQQLGQYLDQIAGGTEQASTTAGPASPRLQKMLDTIRRFASGMSRIGDLGNGAHAAGDLKTRGVGVDIGELSKNGMDMIAHAVHAWKAAVFVDSGAFSAFRAGLKSKAFKPMDFAAVLAKYDKLLDVIGEANEVEDFDYPRPMMVMPDVPGNQAESLALVEQHQKWIKFEIGAKRMMPIIALHAGDLSLSQAYQQIVKTLGDNRFVVGIPAVENAISPADLTAFLKESKPGAIHILGAGHDKTLTPRLQSVIDAGLDGKIQVTADASKVRNAIVRAVKKGAVRGDAISDAVYNEDDPEIERQDQLSQEYSDKVDAEYTLEGDELHPASEEAFAAALKGLMGEEHSVESPSRETPTGRLTEAQLAELAAEQTRGENERLNATFRPTTKPVSLPRVTKKNPVPKGMAWISPEEAKTRLDAWKDEADRQGRASGVYSRNAMRTVISLFDVSGVISQPWVDAGYNVVSYDLQTGADISEFNAENLLEQHGNDEVYAILAQPPCTDFASSGAQWWKNKNEDGRLEASNELVRQVLRSVELFRPPVWVMENPVGRIAEQNDLPPAQLAFDPWHYGDPYTKRTMLWGKFNNDLPQAPVEPVEGSKIHRMSSSAKDARSLTPEGFAYALFMANNAEGQPLAKRLADEFAGVQQSLFEAALQAGKTEEQIRNAIVDSYYDSDLETVRDELKSMAPAAAQAPAAATNTPARDEGLIDLRKRLSVLEALRKCLG